MTDEQQPVAVITGASQGIGEAVALKLANTGANLVLAARNEARLDKVASRIEQTGAGGRCDIVATDVSDESAVKRLFQHVQTTHRRLDFLVNSAGQLLEAPLMTTRAGDLQALFSTNLFGTYYCCQYGSRLMTRQRKGAIVNLASIVGEQGAAGQSAYAASKAAISGLTRSLAKELGPLGIRVNAIAPGFITTAMTAGYEGKRRDDVIGRTLLGRAGDASEVAALAALLLGDAGSYISGQVIAIDGGLTL